MKFKILILFVLVNILCFAICSKIEQKQGYDDISNVLQSNDQLIELDDPNLKSLFSGFDQIYTGKQILPNRIPKRKKNVVLQPKFLERDDPIDNNNSAYSNEKENENNNNNINFNNNNNDSIFKSIFSELENLKTRNKKKDETIRIDKNQKINLGDEIVEGGELLDVYIFGRELKKAICGENSENCDLSFLQEVKAFLEKTKKEKAKNFPNEMRFIETDSYPNNQEFNQETNNLNNDEKINNLNQPQLAYTENKEQINSFAQNNLSQFSNLNENPLNTNINKTIENNLINTNNIPFETKQTEITPQEIPEKDKKYQNLLKNVDSNAMNQLNYNIQKQENQNQPEKEESYNDIVKNINEDALDKIDSNFKKGEVSEEEAVDKDAQKIESKSGVNMTEMDEMVEDILNGKNVKLNDRLTLNDQGDIPEEEY